MGAESSSLLEPLKEGLRSDDSELVGRLLERDPSLRQIIDAPVGPFDSPAIINVRSRGMLDALLEAGADINAKSRWWAGGFGLLHCAPPDVAAYAVERGAVVDVHAAARLGMIEKLAEIVSADPSSLHARGGDGQTALHFAATTEIATFLLEHGADIDAKDIDHESTPAQHMSEDRQEIVRYLIDRGCTTDILMTVAVGDVDLVRSKLDDDPASINTCVSEEYFPMSNPRAGGTIYQWTLGFYMSAHRVARKFGHDDVLELLLDRSPVTVRLLEACWANDEATAEMLRTAFPNAPAMLSDTERRQVADAARNNETSAVRLMLECGLPADARGQHQGTPLHWAAFHGNREMTTKVLQFQPPLEALDADFKATPLGWAIHGSEHGWYRESGDYSGVIEALLEAGVEGPAEVAGSAAVRAVLSRSSRG